MIGLTVLAIVAAFGFYAGHCHGFNKAIELSSKSIVVSAAPVPAPVPAPVEAAPAPILAEVAPSIAVAPVMEPRSVVELCRAHDERIRSGFAQAAAAEAAKVAAAEAEAKARKGLASRKRKAKRHEVSAPEMSVEDQIAAMQDQLQQERMEAQLH